MALPETFPIAFSVQYHGANFYGFQLQKSVRTVQGELEKAFHKILRSSVRVHCSGRTDTGVHALAQVIHIEIPLAHRSRLPPLRRLIYAVNCVLPHDVSLIHGQEMSGQMDGPHFHSRFSCKGREYIYKISNAPFRAALLDGFAHWERTPLDIHLMRRAVEPLIGEHDFGAFTPVSHVKKGEVTIRRLDAVHIISIGHEIYFYFIGSGFLHNMIRILSGSLLEIGKGQMDFTALEGALVSKDRLRAGITLPPDGLYFTYAHYDEYKTPVSLVSLREVLRKETARYIS